MKKDVELKGIMYGCLQVRNTNNFEKRLFQLRKKAQHAQFILEMVSFTMKYLQDIKLAFSIAYVGRMHSRRCHFV